MSTDMQDSQSDHLIFPISEKPHLQQAVDSGRISRISTNIRMLGNSVVVVNKNSLPQSFGTEVQRVIRNACLQTTPLPKHSNKFKIVLLK